MSGHSWPAPRSSLCCCSGRRRPCRHRPPAGTRPGGWSPAARGGRHRRCSRAAGGLNGLERAAGATVGPQASPLPPRTLAGGSNPGGRRALTTAGTHLELPARARVAGGHDGSAGRGRCQIPDAESNGWQPQVVVGICRRCRRRSCAATFKAKRCCRKAQGGQVGGRVCVNLLAVWHSAQELFLFLCVCACTHDGGLISRRERSTILLQT